MDVGIGLPTTIAGVESRQVVDWAQRAEAAGFSSLGTIDRIVYGNWEPLIALAAAATVTSRIKLVTSILILPLRPNAALLAKQAATLQKLSNGRLVLGLAVGNREDDFDAAGVDLEGRGARFERQLDEITSIWDGADKGFAGPIGPTSSPPPSIIIGGSSPRPFRRAAKYDGWIMGGGSPDQFAERLEQVRAAWREAGRDGSPRVLALAYFSLGDDAPQRADAYLKDYYAFTGEAAAQIAAGALTTPEAVRERIDGFAAAGCDELVLFPSSPDPDQVDLLAEAAL
ncbi:MAG TPA: LLM class flavin-dependent oxidoreductase [Thermoleophilaceae bacterium]|jgi:alkanesulfonate monooxygenase SsuD/methylene tetrahydromethanopterin reductase-like flavin-dependent oxidoreductase (luciferase family)